MRRPVNPLNLPEFELIGRPMQNDYDYLFKVKGASLPISCPHCSTPRDYVFHGSRDEYREVRDVDMHGKRVRIHILKRRFKCNACGRTFNERFSCIGENDKITRRLKEQLQKESLVKPYSAVAETYGIAEDTVVRAFREHVESLDRKRDIMTPEVLGIDEVHLNKKMRAVFCDVIGNEGKGKIIEMLDRRSKWAVVKFLQTLEQPKRVKVVTLDMWEQYHNAVKETLPHAFIVVDKFHVIQYATGALDKVRLRIKSIEPDAKKHLKKERYVLLKNREDLTQAEISRREAWFEQFPELKKAYCLKEDLRFIYTASSRHEALQLFREWEQQIPDDMEQFKAVSEMIARWEQPIFNYFDYPYTNAFTESMNGVIKNIQKIGKGYTFENLRAKALYGTPATRPPKFGEQEMYEWKLVTSFTTPKRTPFGVDVPTLARLLEKGLF